MDGMDAGRRLSLGQIVHILRGREAGKVAIVIGYSGPGFVLLADGDKRTADRPKKKNIKHIQPTNQVADEVARSLAETGRVTNAKLRYALNQYCRKQNQGKWKGE